MCVHKNTVQSIPLYIYLIISARLRSRPNTLMILNVIEDLFHPHLRWLHIILFLRPCHHPGAEVGRQRARQLSPQLHAPQQQVEDRVLLVCNVVNRQSGVRGGVMFNESTAAG